MKDATFCDDIGPSFGVNKHSISVSKIKLSKYISFGTERKAIISFGSKFSRSIFLGVILAVLVWVEVESETCIDSLRIY